MAKYYDIHIIVEDDCKTGYSNFVEADTMEDAIQKVIELDLLEDPSDIDYIDYIGEISKKDYLQSI